LTQYCFIDDSGDPGLSNVQTSSTHFALALVQLNKRAPLVELSNIRRMLYLSPNFEFKYHKAKPHQKALFFEAIRPIPFRVYAVVVHKAGLGKQFSTMSGQDFTIEFISSLVLRTSILDIANDVLVVDGATPTFIRSLRIRLSDSCRQLNRVRPFQKIVGGDSSSEDGLQLTDMLAGTIRHYVMGVDRTYYHTFANKVVELWEVPPKDK